MTKCYPGNSKHVAELWRFVGIQPQRMQQTPECSKPRVCHMAWQKEPWAPEAHTPGLKLQLCYLLAHDSAKSLHLTCRKEKTATILWWRNNVNCLGLDQSQSRPTVVTDHNPKNLCSGRTSFLSTLGAILNRTNELFLDESWLCRASESSSWISILIASNWHSEKWQKSE